MGSSIDSPTPSGESETAAKRLRMHVRGLSQMTQSERQPTPALDRLILDLTAGAREIDRLRAEVATLTEMAETDAEMLAESHAREIALEAQVGEARALSVAIILHPEPDTTIGWLKAEARRLLNIEVTLKSLLAACDLADGVGDLSAYVDGSLLDHARAALNPEGGEQ